uniref:Syntaphilin a n=1 Tax=Neogobius melanostomus TaxID=47308 RepID=A0A8C6WKM0_9GOBI
MSLTPSRKPLSQHRRSVTGGSRCTHGSDASVSPTARTYPSTPRRQAKYASCNENHGIRLPTPEQYLTPLQQKEVCIRHLRARLRDNVERLQHRDYEIDDLRTQLYKMQEEWIEGECHRLEAQLALKEARKEIQHLQEVVETVRSNQGGPATDPHDNKPYAGLQTAQPGGRSRSCGCSPASTLSRNTSHKPISTESLHLDPSGVPRPLGQTHHLLLEAALLSEQLPSQRGHLKPSPTFPCASTFERRCTGGALLPLSHSCHSLSTSCGCTAHSYHPHHHLFLHLPQEEPTPTVTTSSDPIPTPLVPIDKKTEVRSQACSPTMTWLSEDNLIEEISVISLSTTDMPSSEPPALQLSLPRSCPVEHFIGADSSPHLESKDEAVVLPQTSQPLSAIQLPVERESPEVEIKEETEQITERVPTQRQHWSRYFLVDFLALAMPVVPTMAWLCRGAPRDDMPVYHIGSLLRGCCAVALHSLRRQGGAASNSQT